MAKATALYKTKSKQAITLANKYYKEATKYYNKANTVMTTIVLPELKAEMESLFNQTLKNSVVMTEEIVKAYTPHVLFIKQEAEKIGKVTLNKAVKLYGQSKLSLQTQIERLTEMIQDLINTLKEHKYTKQAIAQYKKTLKHKYVIKAKQSLNKIIRMTKEKLEELRSHPTTMKYQRKVEQKLQELKKMYKQYKQKAYKMTKDARYKRMVRILTKLQTSAKFTYNKLTEKVQPYYNKMAVVVTDNVEVIPGKALSAFLFFRENPEEAFWRTYNMAKRATVQVVVYVKDIDQDLVKENVKIYAVSLKRDSLNLVDEIFDQWSKDAVEKAYNYVVKMTKKAEKKIRQVPGVILKMAKKSYKEQMQSLRQWYRKTSRALINGWEKCAYNEFVRNEIWADIAGEIKNHELTDATYSAARWSRKQAIAFKQVAVKELKKAKANLQIKLAELQDKLAELRVQLKSKYEEMRVKTMDKYNEMITKYNALVAKANNFVETTTIAHIVEFVQVKYEELVVKVAEAKVELMLAKEKYMRQGKQMYLEYKRKAEVKYAELVAKATDMCQKYVKPRYNKARKQVMKAYNKYYPIVMEKYETLRTKAEEKYEIYSEKAQALYADYNAKARSWMKKTKRQAYQKWMESEVRSKLIQLKGMTIRETIEAIKQLPTQTKTFVAAQYNKYTDLVKAKFNERYAELLRELVIRRQQLQTLTRPYTVPAVEAYKWVENEVKETAIFVYRYHHVEERSLRAKSYIVAEVERLIPIVKENIKQYAQLYKIKSRQLAYDIASTATLAGDKTLRGIHSSFRYVDNMDLSKYQKSMKSYVSELNKYVSIDVVEGEILINIPHRTIEPSFTHHIKKVSNKVRKTVKDVQLASKKLMKKISEEIRALKVKADNLRRKIKQQVLDNTVELRRDMKLSMSANKKIALRVYDNAKLLGQKTYRKAVAQYKIIKQKAKVYLAQLKAQSKVYYKKFMVASRKAYLKGSEIMVDIYSVGPFQMHQRAFFHAKKYNTMAKQQLNKLYKKYKPTAMKMYKAYSALAKSKTEKLREDAEPYYQAVKKAVTQVRNGVSVKKAFQPIYQELVFASRIYKNKMIKQLSQLKAKVCRRDPKLCKLMKESKKIHAKLFTKYSIQALELLTTGKAHFHRAVRKITSCTKRPIVGATYQVAASIFGNHVLTFDKKYFELIENEKPGCGYLLAHDFSNNQFTLKKEGKTIVVETPDMKISINKNGKTKTEIGNDVITTLPVESKSGSCVRKDALVICHFMAKNFKVVVDLKNDITTLGISGWYYGKTQGIFGTYNRETYDDWKLPSGKITDNVYEFINEYEISGKAKCQLKSVATKPKVCNQAPSPKCEGILKSSSSPYAKFFEAVNPEPFWQACMADTSACGVNKNKESYCKSVLAFASFARASGKWVQFLPECLSYKGHEIDSEFKQKPLKNALDVAVLISQREEQGELVNTITKVVKHLNGMLKNKKKLNVKYSLIGFGGDGINERAHVKPLGTGHELFGSIDDLVNEIANIPYDGTDETTNDAYSAILKASTLHFRPGASKVFLLFNSEPHSSHPYGPAFDEVKYALEKEAEATLIGFDKFSFKTFDKRQGIVIGQSTRKVYTTKKWQQGVPRAAELPSSEYKELIEDTNGAMFRSDAKIPKHVSGAVFDVLKVHLRSHLNDCKVCKVTYTWTGATKVLCQTKLGLKC